MALPAPPTKNDMIPPPAPSGRRLILITGSPRSGTTWVGDVLRRCSRTMLLMEPFNPDLSSRVARVCNFQFREWYMYVTNENAAEFTAPIRRMLELRHETLPRLRASKSLKDVIDVSAAAARFGLSRLTAQTSIMKDPIALLSSQWLASQFGARVVILIRHPAAVVSSFKRLKLCVDIPGLLRQPLLMRDLLAPMEAELSDFARVEHDIVDMAAMLWKALYFAVLRFRERHSDWLFLRHEDLSQDPVGGFEDICRHVGLDFPQRARKAAIESNDVALPPELDPQLAFTTRRNAVANLTNWKTRLTEDEISRIRRRVEDVSQQLYPDMP
ncbi:MAG: hypothetical protein JWP03_4353 [Phycisphaerales bacterium]|nr:hypothetical protein [Phycisphaerales bacterium]